MSNIQDNNLFDCAGEAVDYLITALARARQLKEIARLAIQAGYMDQETKKQAIQLALDVERLAADTAHTAGIAKEEAEGAC